jgi:2-dehydro-3-deoxygluconokinase
MNDIQTKARETVRWDCISLGEVMPRLYPDEDRIHTSRAFRAWEGGGEYNVARGLRRCFGLRTAIATALADNPVGRLIEDLMLQGGVDQELVRWTPYDGVGRKMRNGLNFSERGYAMQLRTATQPETTWCAGWRSRRLVWAPRPRWTSRLPRNWKCG